MTEKSLTLHTTYHKGSIKSEAVSAYEEDSFISMFDTETAAQLVAMQAGMQAAILANQKRIRLPESQIEEMVKQVKVGAQEFATSRKSGAKKLNDDELDQIGKNFKEHFISYSEFH